MGGMLSQALSSGNKAREQLAEANVKIDEWKLKYQKLESKFSVASDEVIVVTAQNQLLMKQRNIFCNTARRLYAHLTRLHHSCVISDTQHKRLLPFLTMPVNDVNKLTFDCETIVSCDNVPNQTYSHGIIPVDDLDTEELTNIVNK